MNVVSKEMFFQDNVLFVEGQEDVGLLESYFEGSNINFFGYGVRGCGNFKLAFKLAHDLGIKKACVLIDSSDSSSVDKNEDKIKGELLKNYKPFGYEVIQWNKADIRDKEKTKCPHKNGEFCFKRKEAYFTKNGKKKEEKELDDFIEKIKLITNYFSQ